MNQLIGLTGYKGVGKSEVAKALQSIGDVQILSFASPIKEMINNVVNIDELFAYGKEAPLISLGGNSYREALQSLGTEWGRDFLGKDIWANKGLVKAKALNAAGLNIVFDDVRFDNEAQAILYRGGIVVELERESIYEGNDTHESEKGVSSEYITATIDNSGDVEETVKEILGL